MKAWLMDLRAKELEAAFPYVSHIDVHEDCPDCIRMQAWVAGRTRAMMRARDYDSPCGGSWLADAYEWGAHPWPLSWCHLKDRKEIDCGAFASLYSYCLEISRVPHNRVQMTFAASPQERAEWGRKWRDASVTTAWIREGYVYHESIIADAGESGNLLIDTTDMVILGERCDDPRYMPQFIRVTSEGWRPASGLLSVAGRSLRVGLWEAWEPK